MEEIMERSLKSKQPRIVKPDPDEFFSSILQWQSTVEFQEVAYGSTDTRLRDKYLSKVWTLEPHLAGVLNGATLIDSNRGWSLTGGRNQVNRYLNIFHNFENGAGYNFYQRRSALAYRTSDLGSVTEIGRDGKRGPLRTLWNVDPTKCKINKDGTLNYYPQNSKLQKWAASDYFRVVSMPSIFEDMNGIGFCGVSRAIELTKIMLGLLRYDQEKLRAAAPEGFLLLRGISEDQWKVAMQSRRAEMEQKEREYFGSVFVFASNYEIAATLITLAQIPEQFDRAVFTDLLMYAYSLVFGYSPDEFWPVRFGSLGRGTEAAVQHRKAVTKGGADYTILWQEQVQKLLPTSLLFQFDERDVTGETEDALLQQEKVKGIRMLYDPAGQTAGLISRDEARTMLAEEGIIPSEWTLTEEDVTANEEVPVAQSKKEIMINRIKVLQQTDSVLRAAYQYPGEPIISAKYFGNNKIVFETVAQPGELISKQFISVPVLRAANDVLYDGAEFAITEQDVDRAIAGAKKLDNEFAGLLEAEVVNE